MTGATALRADEPRRRLELFCTWPARGFERFSGRLHACVAPHADQVDVRWFDDAAALARATRFAAVVSTTQPTVVLLREGVVIGNALGDLPAHELRGILRHAVDATR